jgi:hypothetical protein
MALIGDDESDTSSLDNDTSETSSAVIGAEEGGGVDLQHAQYDPPTHNRGDETVSVGEDQEEEPEDIDRANRFEGQSSTWRFYIEQERTLANSLDQQRANDLSLHLYNAHVLKARVRDPNAATNVEPDRSKKRWIKPNEDGTLPWYPDAAWTAWPLQPGDVPRTCERFGVPVPDDGLDSETYKKTKVWKPSGDLEEKILAIALRSARERLRNASPGDRSTAEDDARQEEIRTRKESHETMDEGSDIDVSMAEEDDDADQLDQSTQSAEFTTENTANKSLLVDDEAARTLLSPSIRHVLSQLDGLLTGLHKSRRGQMRTNLRSRSRTPRSRSTSKAGKPTSKSRSRQPSRSKSLQGDENETHDSDSGDDVEEDDRNNDRPKKRRPLNPRDWSEVLGMAAFTRWDAEVVDRATRRCVSLFGEGMNFRTVTLNPIDKTDTELRTYGLGVLPATTTAADDNFVVDDQPAANRYYCPVLSCERHEESYDRAWRLYEHVRRAHKYSSAQVERLKTKLRRSEKEEADLAKTSLQGETKAIGTAEEAHDADAMHVDPLLQPVTVKMGRGKDKHPRRGKTSRS